KDRAVKAAIELCDVCNIFGYGEIKPSGSAYYSGSMIDVFSKIERENFQMLTIEKKEDLWPAFKSFLLKDKTSPLNATPNKTTAEGAQAAT
ncbi:MAG: DUF444 family protein, partial [Bdellovibrionota bacterium]